jgi:hypothetical protein
MVEEKTTGRKRCGTRKYCWENEEERTGGAEGEFRARKGVSWSRGKEHGVGKQKEREGHSIHRDSAV